MGLFNRGMTERERSHYERQIELLQSQLLNARAEAQRHCDRADAAVDELVKRIGLRAISDQGKQEEAQRAAHTEQIAEHAAQRADLMFEEVPFGDPRGRYKTQAEASIEHEDDEPALPPLSHFLGKAA